MLKMQRIYKHSPVENKNLLTLVLILSLILTFTLYVKLLDVAQYLSYAFVAAFSIGIIYNRMSRSYRIDLSGKEMTLLLLLNTVILVTFVLFIS